MEIKSRKVVFSKVFEKSLENVYNYGRETFGKKAANYFIDELYEEIIALQTQYYLHPECRYLRTKNKIYRNIIKGAYLIIYRIQESSVELLIAIRGNISKAKYKEFRKIKID